MHFPKNTCNRQRRKQTPLSIEVLSWVCLRIVRFAEPLLESVLCTHRTCCVTISPADAACIHWGNSMSGVHPSRAAHATRPTVAVSMASLSLTRAAVGLAALVMLLVCCTRTVDAKEVKGLGFYPPFQTFNARGVRGCVLLRLCIRPSIPPPLRRALRLSLRDVVCSEMFRCPSIPNHIPPQSPFYSSKLSNRSPVALRTSRWRA